MKFEKTEDYKIKDNDIVYLKHFGNIKQVLYMKNMLSDCPIKILNKNEYQYKATGEIFKIEHKKLRNEHIKSLKRTFMNLKNLINTNLTDITKTRFITLTYAENMQDNKKLYNDLDKFLKKFKYHLKNKLNINNFEYISICEPQGRGAWHCHLILFFDVKAPFIENNIIANLWGNGFTKTVALKNNVDDFGRYFCAYFTDLELENNEQFIIENYETLKNLDCINVKDIIFEDNGIKTSKRIIKGARLLFYPINFNLYRCSRGIKRPIREKLKYSEVKEKIGSIKPISSTSLNLLSDNIIINSLTIENYNMIKV